MTARRTRNATQRVCVLKSVAGIGEASARMQSLSFSPLRGLPWRTRFRLLFGCRAARIFPCFLVLRRAECPLYTAITSISQIVSVPCTTSLYTTSDLGCLLRRSSSARRVSTPPSVCTNGALMAAPLGNFPQSRPPQSPRCPRRVMMMTRRRNSGGAWGWRQLHLS